MTSTAPSRRVNLSISSNIIRNALAFESLLTISVGLYYVFFPRHYLLLLMGAAAAEVTTTALQCAQHYGAASVLVGAGVACFIPNTKSTIESRRTVYFVILVFELLIIPLLVWQALMMKGGLPKASLLATAGQFVPFVLWRVFTLGYKPEWFGRYLDEKKVK